MGRPSPLSPIQAHEAVQLLLERRDSISYTIHARQRMRVRNFTVDDVRRVLMFGTVSSTPQWKEEYQDWTYVFSGFDYDNVPLAIVIALDLSQGRITVITGQDDD